MGIEYAFVPLPHAIIYDDRLSLGAKVTYMFLRARCLDKEYCLLGQERLAQEMRLSERTVRRHIQELKKFGIIQVRPRMGTSAVTIFVHIPDAYTASGTPFMSEPLNGPNLEDTDDLSIGQNCPNDPDIRVRSIRTPVADKEEKDEKEKDTGQDLMDLLEEDPAIQQAFAHEKALQKKAKKAAKQRLSEPSIPRGKKASPPDFSKNHDKRVPGTVAKWDGSKWFTQFKDALTAGGINLEFGYRTAAVNALTNVRTALSTRGLGAAEQYKFLCQWLPENWVRVEKQLFKSARRGAAAITLTVLGLRLTDILAAYQTGSCEDILKDAIRSGKVRRVKV